MKSSSAFVFLRSVVSLVFLYSTCLFFVDPSHGAHVPNFNGNESSSTYNVQELSSIANDSEEVSSFYESNNIDSIPPNHPHIVFIVADDLGWNDVSWHNPDIITPNMDKLAREGVILNQSYVQPLCSPSRGAFMTGLYPFHTGLQHGVIKPLEPTGLRIDLKLLPEYLKTAGYRTHVVGKWHLGFCDWKYTPLYRGFDTHLGFYNGAGDYFQHTRETPFRRKKHVGLDFRVNLNATNAYAGQYSTTIFGQRAETLISEHNASEPMFLYMPFQAVHSPLQVPDQYKKLYPNIKDKQRRQYSAMVSAMDEAIGNVTDALRKYGLYDNTVIIFTTDNGGPHQLGANNWPLRGSKKTLWEGGTRGAAFVHSQLLQKRGYVHNEKIHAVDWFPTILRLAGVAANTSIDGVDQWDSISTNLSSPRNAFVHNIDNFTGSLNAAIRVGDYKLIVGWAGGKGGWYPVHNLSVADEDEICYEEDLDTDDDEDEDSSTRVRLFNIRDDPLEKIELSDKHPDIVTQLKTRLEFHVSTMMASRKKEFVSAGLPENFGNVWSPGWCNAD